MSWETILEIVMMRCVSLAAVCLLSLVMIAPVRAADAGEELAPVLKKAGGWESYRFTVEAQPGAGGMLEGRYQKGQPLACKADRIELFKKGEVIVYGDAGKWQKSRTGRLSDPLRVLGAVAKVRTVRLPHEELVALAMAVRSVKKAEAKEGGLTVYRTTLDRAAAQPLARPEHKGVAQGGSARFWVSKDGNLAKYAVSIRVQGRLGGAEIDGTMTKTVTLSGGGSTKVEVPEAARKALK
jgi:hypothetical protein